MSNAQQAIEERKKQDAETVYNATLALCKLATERPDLYLPTIQAVTQSMRKNGHRKFTNEKGAGI